MAGLSQHVKLYMKINDNLSEDDVRILRATLVTDGHLGQARLENATPLDIFNMLEADDKIGTGNLALLGDLLKGLGKTELAQEAEDVAKCEQTEGPSCAIDDVISCLKDLYGREHASVRPLPWCEDFHLPLEQLYTNLQHLQHLQDDRKLFQEVNIVSLTDIYKTNEAKAKNGRLGVRRIRVEGDPGIGKSCSCQKLALDWVSGKLGIFKVVFFLEIRHMSGKVKDAIFEQLLSEDTNMTPDQLWSYIQENQDDVLFILDGLDELSQKARENTDVMSLIQGKVLRNCHVLVTSRSYHCDKELARCDEFYKILAYSSENSAEFIKKYFSHSIESATKLIEQLTSNPNLSRLVENPLNSVLMCIVWEDNEGKLPSSQAELYQMIVCLVAKRYCARKDIPLEGDEIPSNIEEALRGLGKLYWEGLGQNQFQFRIADIRENSDANGDVILDFGLLTRDKSVSRIKRTFFLHRAFQEYVAAYYISELVKNDAKREEGREYLRSLFGMSEATASFLDMELMSRNRLRYGEVQNSLLAFLGVNSGSLFEFFAEELGIDECKEEDKDLLSFVCIMLLGRVRGEGRMHMAEIVAPCLSQHITNQLGFFMDERFRDDHARWIDGLTQVIKCQNAMAIDQAPRLIQHLSIDTTNIQSFALQQQQIVALEDALSDCTTIAFVTLRSRNELMRATHKFSPVRAFIPQRGTESVHIDFRLFLDMDNMLSELSALENLQHVTIDIGSVIDAAGYSQLSPRLADLVMKQSCLRSLKVKIVDWLCHYSHGSRGIDSKGKFLLSISEHKTLEVVEVQDARKHVLFQTLGSIKA
ncbi:PREDICTED: uncharacterized protein LOC109466915 [Branchiostoma belcheri]|uniref:Uncharacterized protein LOC109466915 n=1 Tax=Branchiostoma belcheri TaxID=7741 RepID=A0A6P4XUP0_BRABE|nr:PREDICTED: uncharacterized protein LOC109466915 [Branchiostoma belcheri]